MHHRKTGACYLPQGYLDRPPDLQPWVHTASCPDICIWCALKSVPLEHLNLPALKRDPNVGRAHEVNKMLTAKRNLAELGAIKDVGTETHPILLHGYKISPENVHNSVLPQYFTFSAPLTCGHRRATGVDFCWWYFTEALQLPWLKQSDPRSEQREGSLIHNECIHHSHTMGVVK